MNPNHLTAGPDWRAILRRIAAWRPDWARLAARLKDRRPDWHALRMRAQALPAPGRDRWRRWRVSLPKRDRLIRTAADWRARATLAIANVRRHPATPRVVTGILVILLVAVVAIISVDHARYDSRRHMAEADANHALELAAERRHAAATDVQHAVELAEARRQLAELRDQIATASSHLVDKSQELAKANVTIEELRKQRAQRHLSYDEKRALIAALRAYRGQRISVAAIYGDDEAKTYAEDLVQALDAAGWSLDAAGITFQRWNRTPIGVEVTLNEADARAGRLSAGTGALINAVRRLGLVDGNTVFMNPDVPAGEVQLRVGHRLQAATPAN